jgi:predicted RND superfamily exporter protein
VVSLVSGVFLAFFVTLLMVPALYAIGFDISDYWARARQRLRERLGERKAAKQTLTAHRTR